MTRSPKSSTPFEFSYEQHTQAVGSRAKQPEISLRSWGLKSTGQFAFSQASDPSTNRKLFQSQNSNRQDELRKVVQEANRNKQVTPEAVEAYAELHLQRDDGESIKAAAHHRLWLRLLCDEQIRKLLIIAPPESAKTTWAILCYVGCLIGIFPEKNVIIGSATAELAIKRSLSLRAMVTKPEWRDTFPGVSPIYAADGGLKWSTQEWSLAPEGKPFPGRLHPTVSAYGTGGTIEGARADLVLGDDLLNFEMARSPTEREKTEGWAHASFLSRRKSRVGRAVIIGTSWHPEDYIARTRAAGDWVVCHISLLGDGEDFYATLTYPDKWDGERIGEPVGQG